MPMTLKNIAQHELIGLPVRVLESGDPTVKGASGKVVDETRNMLLFEDASTGKVRSVQKNGTVFEFDLGRNQKARVSGSDIAYRPEDRVKKAR